MGGSILSLYALSVSHVCDFIAPKDLICTVQGLVLLNSIGLAVGAYIPTWFISIFSLKMGIQVYFIVIAMINIFVLLSRSLLFRTKRNLESHHDFVALPQSTATTVEIDPRCPELD